MFRRTRAETVPAEHAAPEPGAGRPAARFGLGFIGLAILLLGAWGGIVPYVGPAFGFREGAGASWQWTTSHALLWLAPGAAAFLAGLVLLTVGPRAFHRGTKSLTGLASLLALASGLWFVLGPEAYVTFHRTVAVAHGSALARFVTDVGYNLGVGLCLTAFGALALGLVRTPRSEAAVAEARRTYPRAA